jgi:hypothetical protein
MGNGFFDSFQNAYDQTFGSQSAIGSGPGESNETKEEKKKKEELANAPFVELARVQTEEARKKERFDVNSSRLASIFFREQSLGGSKKQQPDMLSEFLGL